MLALLGVVANPLDDEAVLGVLSGSACGASPDTLWMLRRLALDRRERERLRQVLADRPRARAGQIPTEAERSVRGRARSTRGTSADCRPSREVESLRDEYPRLGLEGNIEAACSGCPRLATLMRDGGAARWGNVQS